MSEQNELLEYCRRIETKLDGLILSSHETDKKVVKIDTYQKTHWEKLQKHSKKIEDAATKEDLEEVEARVARNESLLNKAAGAFSIVTLIVSAWIGEFFKRGA